MFVWHKDKSKKKSEGVWVRGIVVSQEGAMALVEVHRAVLRVSQSKVRRDGDPWHDVAIPRLMIHEALNAQRYVKTVREAHLTMRHSSVWEIRFWIVF